MTFKDVKNGWNLYMLHKGEQMQMNMGKVVAVSMPRFQPQQNMLQPTQQPVIDITIDDAGQQRTYTIPETLEVTYAGEELTIAVSKEAAVRELEAMKSRADEAIATIDRQRRVSAQCARLLEEHNPAMKEKRENEERFERLESMMQKLLEKMG